MLKKAILGLEALHMLAWLAMLVAFAGIGFLAFGIYGLIATSLPAWAAAMIVGGGLLVMVALVIAIAVFKATRSNRKSKRESDSNQKIEDELATILGEQATRWTRKNTNMALLGALAAGALLASSPGSRKTLYIAARPLLTRKLRDIIRRFAD